MENLKGGFARAFVLVKVAPRSEGDERLAQYTFVAPIDRVSAATAGRSRGHGGLAGANSLGNRQVGTIDATP